MQRENGNRLKFVIIPRLCILAALCFAWLTPADDRDADLIKQAKDYFGPLPKVIESAANPVTPEKTGLGKMLFYETRVSVDGTVSCVRCHPFSLYAVDGLPKSVGHDARANARNAPTVLNAAGQISAHWTGNREDVEDQARQALVGPASFGMPSYETAEKKLKEIPGYGPLFLKAFPGEKDPVTAEHFAEAVGAFERTLVTPSPFDAFLKGGQTALTDRQKVGLKNFIETGCVQCHSGTYLGGQTYEKFGALEPYWTHTKSAAIDEGRFTVTKKADDKFVFKVPGLRNVAMTSPYFHDGSVSRLADAVSIMGRVQLGRVLGAREVEAIVAFLDSLTGSIPENALRVPILPRNE
jgi:cytochrome c peroxidase